MRSFRRCLTGLLALAVTLGLAVTTTPVAAADAKQACAQELGIDDLPNAADAAAKTPVILVHGLWSKASMWSEGSPSMITALAKTNGVAIVKPFDYESASDDWVTEGDTAQRLAKTIVCYSRLYGDKKVVIVAHSMGGLLTRAALDWAAYGTFAKKVTGHVVTIGTPHTGADMASISYFADISLCQATFVWWGDEARENCRQIEGEKAVAAMHPGSDELAKLPKFPSGISVRAIAGEVSQQVCAPWGCSPALSTGGDLVVPEGSATDEYTITGAGDGKTIFTCTDPVAIPNVSHPWCEHNSMTKAPQVQAKVRASIEAYLALRDASNPPTGVPYDFFNTMTLYLKSDLRVQVLHGEGPSSYDVACADKQACPAFSVYSPNEVGGDLEWKDWGLPECSAAQDGGTNLSTFGPIVQKGTRQIGGRTAKYYEAELCAEGVPRETARFWEVEGGSIFIADVSGNNRWQSEEDAILSTATWK